MAFSVQNIEKMDQLVAALAAVKELRSSVGQVFETLGNGVQTDGSPEEGDNKFLQEMHELLNTTNNNLR